MAASNLVLDQVQGELIVPAWPHMEPLFKRACERTPTALTPAAILYKATAGEMALWSIYDRTEPLPLLGAAATAIYDDVIRIEALGGRDLKRWLRPVLSEFERLAAANGMTAVDIEGRMGWQRLLGADYRPRWISMRKQLT